MNEFETKPALSSLTINASLVSVLLSILAAFGVDISPEAVPQLSAILAGVSAVVAIYGRLRAKTLIR